VFDLPIISAGYEPKFRQILRDDFAMDKKIGRFVAGRYWREMAPKQKRTYQKLFSEWVLKTALSG